LSSGAIFYFGKSTLDVEKILFFSYQSHINVTLHEAQISLFQFPQYLLFVQMITLNMDLIKTHNFYFKHFSVQGILEIVQGNF
jgi:hypothetical protein